LKPGDGDAQVILRTMKPGLVALAAALGFVACATVAGAAGASVLTDPIGALGAPAAPWHVVGLPRQAKPYTRYQVVERDGQRVLEIAADASYGTLLHELSAGITGRRLSWSWRIERDNPAIDLRTRSGDDHVLAVCALFDLPLDAVPFVERQLLRLARLFSGQVLPAASLCYGWDARQPRDTVLDSPYTRRVRLIVLRGAGDPPQVWRHEERDLPGDFSRLFGDESPTLPPLRAVLIAADADNTGGHSIAHLKDLQLR
jgi:hypothetical protein